MCGERVLVVGATSAIARAFAIRCAKDGSSLFLAARNAESLRLLSDDCRRHGARRVAIHEFRAEEMAGHGPLVEAAFDWLGGFDAVLIAHGVLPDQNVCEDDPGAVAEVMTVNATSAMTLSLHVAAKLELQRSGVLALISSVAGDRGRRSNYVYGASKACVNTFCEGLRARLHRVGATVLTIKPGMVRSPMTAHLPESRLLADADAVAGRIYSSIQRRKAVVYAPGYWRMIMMGIRAMPSRVLNRLNI